MELRMYVDESGSSALIGRLSRFTKWKARLFVLAAVLVNERRRSCV